MTIVVSSSSQSDMGDIKSKNWSNSLIRSSSSAASLSSYWLARCFSFVVMPSVTSFTVGSGDLDFHVAYLISF